jgi:hypothetical protein
LLFFGCLFGVGCLFGFGYLEESVFVLMLEVIRKMWGDLSVSPERCNILFSPIPEVISDQTSGIDRASMMHMKMSRREW